MAKRNGVKARGGRRKKREAKAPIKNILKKTECELPVGMICRKKSTLETFF